MNGKCYIEALIYGLLKAHDAPTPIDQIEADYSMVWTEGGK